MLFEFQLSADTLGRIVRNQLHNSDLCITDSFNYQGDELMVNRIRVLETTSLTRSAATFAVQTGRGTQNVHGFKATLLQPIGIDLVKVSDLLTNGIAPTTPFISLEVSVLLGITAFVDNGAAKLRFAFDTIDFGLASLLIDAAKQQQINNSVSGIVPPITRTIDIGGLLRRLSSATLTVTNTGVTASSGGEILILRLEVNGDGNQAALWSEFYNTYDRNLVGERNWALLIDQELLRQSIINQVRKQLEGAGEKFALDGSVNATWAPAQGVVYNISFSGEVIDACTCFWGEIDVNVDVDTSVTLSVPSTNLLRSRIHTEYDADNWEVACCALTAGLFWPVIGIIYMKDDKVNFGQYLLGWLVGPLVRFIAACVIAGNQSVADLVTSAGTCGKVDDKTIDCDQPFSLLMGALGGSYHLTAISAQSDGPVLAGTTSGIWNLVDPLLVVDSFHETHWRLAGSCMRGYKFGQSGSFRYHNSMQNSILRVCEVTVLDDRDHVFSVERDDYSCWLKVTPSLPDSYLSDPYPGRVRIITNGGVRIVTFAPAMLLDDALSEEVRVVMMAATPTCYIIPWSTRIKWLLERGLKPPPYDELDISQLWQLVAAELQPGMRVELVGANEKVLASAVVGARGIAQVSYWAEPGQGLGEVSLRVQDMRTDKRVENSETRWHLSGQQVQLNLRSRILVDGEFVNLALGRVGRSTVVTLGSACGEHRYDITWPDAPSLLSHSINAPVSGMFHRYTPAGRNLEVSDRHIASAEKVVLEGVVANPIDRVEAVKVAGTKEAICVRDVNDAFTVMDLSELKKPQEIGRYFHTPWFFESKRSGKFFAKLAANRRELLIFVVDKIKEI